MPIKKPTANERKVFLAALSQFSEARHSAALPSEIDPQIKNGLMVIPNPQEIGRLILDDIHANRLEWLDFFLDIFDVNAIVLAPSRSGFTEPPSKKYILPEAVERARQGRYNKPDEIAANPAIIDLLLARNANPNLAGPGQEAPLSIAVKWGNVQNQGLGEVDGHQTIDQLIAHGADPSFSGSSAETPFMVAASCNDLSTLQKLYALSPAQLNTPSHHHTPLGVVIDRPEKQQVANQLLAWGADINAKVKNKLSALEILYRRKQPGEAPSVFSDRRKIADQFAAQSNNPDIRHLAKSVYGANMLPHLKADEEQKILQGVVFGQPSFKPSPPNKMPLTSATKKKHKTAQRL